MNSEQSNLTKSFLIVRKISFSIIIMLITFCLFRNAANTSSLSPPPSRTGAPGEDNCSSSCHTGSLNTGPGNITFSLEGESYLPDSIISVSVKIEDTTKSRFGFQITALDSNNFMAGTFIKGTNTSMTSAGGKSYIGHQNAKAANTWQFQWKSPANAVGDIVFYLAMNAANGNNNTSGDNIYTRSYVVKPILTDIQDRAVKIEQLKLFPNPAKEMFNLSIVIGKETNASLKLLDMYGKTVLVFFEHKIIHGRQNIPIELDKNLNSGLYLVIFETEKLSVAKKLFISK